MTSIVNGPNAIDLRSDTLTQPTTAMREAMASAKVGDDQYGEDPSVNRLEELSADLMGKEAGLFVASGTMGNLVSALAWCSRGDELICGVDAHLLVNEMGGIATLGGIQMRTLPNNARGLMDASTVESTISPRIGMFPRTALLCIENTHNRGNGSALSPTDLAPLTNAAHGSGLAVHLDGARLFNASVALGLPAIELAASSDSVTFCLSKGLSCPAGSVVVGPADFIARARRVRRMVGGAMRQAGILAAAGLVALETMIDRLSDDHKNARRLAEGLADIPGLRVNPLEIETNIVYAELEEGGGPAMAARLKDNGVLVNGRFDWVRFVTRREITAEDIEDTIVAVREVAERPA